MCAPRACLSAEAALQDISVISCKPPGLPQINQPG